MPSLVLLFVFYFSLCSLAAIQAHCQVRPCPELLDKPGEREVGPRARAALYRSRVSPGFTRIHNHSLACVAISVDITGRDRGLCSVAQ